MSEKPAFLAAPHVPVMLREVTEALAPKDGAIFIDGTFGAGGYSRALLAAANCRVLGIDRDPEAVARGREMAKLWDGRLDIVEGRFADMDRIAEARGIALVDGIALDLGISSPQIDTAERGFSFQADGPLDMRMEMAGPSAADLVNEAPEAELADIIRDLGEERFARKVARAIVEARQIAPIRTTFELAEIVRKVVRRSNDGIDPATRTFQALRLAVNAELEQLDRGLEAAERILAPGAVLAVVSFHSLEDRKVKAFLREKSGGGGRGSRHLPEIGRRAPSFEPPIRLVPTRDELAANPRARSARMRAARRTSAPAVPGGVS